MEKGERQTPSVENRKRGPKRRTLPVVVAIAIAAIVVVATATYLLDYQSKPTAPGLPVGPGIQITVDPATSGNTSLSVSPSELANVTVQIFSFVPTLTGYTAVNLAGANVTSNPYLDELFQGTPNSNGLVEGNLSTQFYPVNQAWLSTAGSMTQTVSLKLYATLTITQNGTTDQYTYTNNIPYSPRAPPVEFLASVYFPPQPTFSLPASATTSAAIARAPAERPPPSCNDGYYWDPTSSTYISDGTVPLAIVNATGSPSGAIVSYGISYADTALELSFTSATAWANDTAYSGLQMSSAPSWAGDDTSYQGGTYTNAAVAGGDPNLIGLGGAELTVWDYEEAHVTGTWPNCVSTWLPYYSSNAQIDGFASGATYDFVTTNLPTYFGSLLADMHDWNLLASETLDYGGSGTQVYSVLETAAGYNNAQDAENSAESAFSAFDLAIGIALLACDVLDEIPGFSTVDSAPEAAVVIGDVMGVFGDLMTLFSTISFSTTEHTSVEQFTVNVNTAGAHDNLNAAFYTASTAEQLSVGGSNYDTDMPLLYVDVT